MSGIDSFYRSKNEILTENAEQTIARIRQRQSARSSAPGPIQSNILHTATPTTYSDSTFSFVPPPTFSSTPEPDTATEVTFAAPLTGRATAGTPYRDRSNDFLTFMSTNPDIMTPQMPSDSLFTEVISPLPALATLVQNNRTTHPSARNHHQQQVEEITVGFSHPVIDHEILYARPEPLAPVPAPAPAPAPALALTPDTSAQPAPFYQCLYDQDEEDLSLPLGDLPLPPHALSSTPSAPPAPPPPPSGPCQPSPAAPAMRVCVHDLTPGRQRAAGMNAIHSTISDFCGLPTPPPVGLPTPPPRAPAPAAAPSHAPAHAHAPAAAARAPVHARAAPSSAPLAPPAPVLAASPCPLPESFGGLDLSQLSGTGCDDALVPPELELSGIMLSAPDLDCSIQAQEHDHEDSLAGHDDAYLDALLLERHTSLAQAKARFQDVVMDIGF